MATAKGKRRKRKPETDSDDKVQLALFVEEAKALEVEAGVKAFERALNKLSRQGRKKPPNQLTKPSPPVAQKFKASRMKL